MIRTSRGFGDMLGYVFDSLRHEGSENIRVVSSTGLMVTLDGDRLPVQSESHIEQCFASQACRNTHVPNPAMHVILSWSDEDAPRLSDERMARAAGEYLRRMGWEGGQHMVVRHSNTDNPHCHIIVNKVGLDGSVLPTRNAGLKSRRVCAQLDEEMGYAQGRPMMIGSVPDAPDPREQVHCNLAVQILAAASEARDVRDMGRILEERGVDVRLTEGPQGEVKGISFRAGDSAGRRHAMSGTQVCEACSAPALAQAIALRDRMPRIMAEAEFIRDIYTRADTLYPIPDETRREYAEMDRQLRRLDDCRRWMDEDPSLRGRPEVYNTLFASEKGEKLLESVDKLSGHLLLPIRYGCLEPTRDAVWDRRGDVARIDDDLWRKYPSRDYTPGEYGAGYYDPAQFEGERLGYRRGLHF